MFLTIILGILGLGIVIFIHETGHFIAAKLSGISVEVFSIGWGKALVSWTRGGTEYRIGFLPMGGYCRMKGGDLLQKAMEERADTIPHEEGSFFSASPLKRIFVSATGPFFNLLSAFIIFSVIWGIGFSIQSYGNRIVLVSDYSNDLYPADRGGLKTGDKIITINDKIIHNYDDIKENIATAAGVPLEVGIIRGEIRKTLDLVPERDPETGMGILGVYAWIDPVVGSTEKGSPAYIAGIRPDDLLLSVDGKTIEQSIDFMKMLETRPSRINLTYRRGDKIEKTTLIISYSSDGLPDLGITFKPLTFKSEKETLLSAIGKGFNETYSTLKLSVKSIGLLFSGINLRNNVSGPIRLTYYVGTVAASGFTEGIKNGLTNIFRFLSVLGVFFFFMNLLPIPALDGGHIVLHLIEAITGKAPKPVIIYRYQLIGFTILIGIMIFSTFNDVSFFVSK